MNQPESTEIKAVDFFPGFDRFHVVSHDRGSRVGHRLALDHQDRVIKAHDGNGEAVAEAHIQRRCVEEAQETIPGFLHGETMLSAEDPGLVCVMCTWKDEAAYQALVDSPVRAKQTADLAGVIAADIKTLSFRSIHTVAKPE